MSHDQKTCKTIRAKLNLMVVAVSLLSIFILGAVALTTILQMRSQTVDINAHMGRQAADDSRQMLEDEAVEKLRAVASDKAETIDARLQSIMSQVDILAAAGGALYAAPGDFKAIPVYPADASRQGEFTAQIVYAARTAPEAVAGEVGLLGNLTVTMKQTSAHLAGVGTTQIGTESGFIIMCDENSGLKTDLAHLEPTERSWYRMAADSGALIWSDVFEDSYGRGLAVTCGKPVYGPGGERKAVVSIGSTLDDISSTVTNTTIGESGYAFVVDRSGDVIMSRNMKVDGDGHVSNKENLLENGEQTVRDAARLMVSGEPGVMRAVYGGMPVYMAFEPMRNVPWTVVTVMGVDEVLSPSVEGEARISSLTEQAGADIDRLIGTAGFFFLLALAAAMALSAALGTTFSGRLTRPLHHLTEGVERIGGGDLGYKLDLRTGDEIEGLTNAFNAMTDSLQSYIRDLTAVTAEKERIGAELSVATEIQASMLPCIFPAFPDRPEFDIFADMHPAKEVGGDFYDFFLTDEDHLWVVMADVSGKGVPAALFMVIAKTLLKNHAGFLASPAEVLTVVNDQLCETNEAGMFVTTFMGRLELSTGVFDFANAGHNFPLLSRKGEAYEWLKTKPNFVLAGMEGVRFQDHRVDLRPGDRLFLYTDGVTEALDPAQALYGDPRLADTLNSPAAHGLELAELVGYIKADIARFADGAAQADDITMLALELRERPAGKE